MERNKRNDLSNYFIMYSYEWNNAVQTLGIFCKLSKLRRFILKLFLRQNISKPANFIEKKKLPRNISTRVG